MPQNPILFDDGFTIVFDNNSNHAGLLPHTVIYLLNGDDDVTATSNSWVYVYGGMGNDELIRWSGAAAGSSLYGEDGNDKLVGGNFADKLYGGDGQDTILGNGGEDFMYGGQSNDLLRGGLGQDNMWGGGGPDTFDFDALSETPTGAANRDIIRDFDHAELDIIDLATIDAKAGVFGNQAFTFIGSQAFHDVKGELHFLSASAYSVVQGDTNGDGVADFAIKVVGVSSLVAADFVL
jgi:serralysin